MHVIAKTNPPTERESERGEGGEGRKAEKEGGREGRREGEGGREGGKKGGGGTATETQTERGMHLCQSDGADLFLDAVRASAVDHLQEMYTAKSGQSSNTGPSHEVHAICHLRAVDPKVGPVF